MLGSSLPVTGSFTTLSPRAFSSWWRRASRCARSPLHPWAKTTALASAPTLVVASVADAGRALLLLLLLLMLLLMLPPPPLPPPPAPPLSRVRLADESDLPDCVRANAALSFAAAAASASPITLPISLDLARSPIMMVAELESVGRGGRGGGGGGFARGGGDVTLG